MQIKFFYSLNTEFIIGMFVYYSLKKSSDNITQVHIFRKLLHDSGKSCDIVGILPKVHTTSLSRFIT